MSHSLTVKRKDGVNGVGLAVTKEVEWVFHKSEGWFDPRLQLHVTLKLSTKLL